MLKQILCLAVIATAGGEAAFLSAAAVQVAPLPASVQRAVLNRYCVTCHNERLKTAGLMLDRIDVENVPADAPLWERVVRKLRTGAMPPADMPRPDKATNDSLALFLEAKLDEAAAVKPNPGSTGIHRMNRAEYTNAIRDLLALDIDAESLLPPDDSGYGFDNIADILSVSPALMERYLSAARKISRLAVGERADHPDLKIYELPQFLRQDDRMSEALPFGSRGGIAIHHHFPSDGEYVIKVHLKRTYNDSKILGLSKAHELDIRLDGARIKLIKFGGEYGDRAANFVRPGSAFDTGSDLELQKYLQTADDGLEIRVPVRAGARVVGIAFIKATSESESVIEPSLAEREGDNPAVANVVIKGPYAVNESSEIPVLRRNSECGANSGLGEVQLEEACARKILSKLARLAYRRPVTEADIEPLLEFYKAGRSAGDFQSGIAAAIEAILVDSEFLFRIERDPAPGAANRLSGLEMASRLSFFLWSSIPDNELLDLAERGKLKEAAVLAHQIQRMLADARSKAVVDNFAGQWLYLRNMRSVSPDRSEFADFDENLREAFEQETELFLGSMLHEDHSVLDLLNANYTFVNERLARHYGIPDVYGSHFRRVILSSDERKGLLGQGSVLTVTSYANRTSPTLRGKWLLTNILGTPPPPPPPNVPSLKDRGEDGKILSVRQQMEQHRANAVCASCHARMDPLGFALENFDAIGRWRTTSGAGNTLIDASGVLPNGEKFSGPAGLRNVLLRDPEQFVTTVTEKLLTYALGRGVEYYDEPAVRKIVRDAAPGYRWSSLISGIVRSVPFQMRRVREP